jgi:plasmid stability protein
MLVIVSLRRLDNDRVEVGVARPQHDSNPAHNYASEKEVRAVLSDFGISEESIASHLKLLAQMGTGEQLKFPPMDVPQNDLLSRKFRL